MLITKSKYLIINKIFYQYLLRKKATFMEITNLTSRGFLLLSMLLTPFCLKGQADMSLLGENEYYFRIMSVSGFAENAPSFTVRPFTIAQHLNHESHPWSQYWKSNLSKGFELPAGLNLAFIEPYFFQSYNTTLPRGGNDGAIWQGKGWNSAVSFGAVVNWGPLHLRLQPIAGFTENRFFDTGPFVENYLDTLFPIDNVPRFGNSSYAWSDWGDSRAELRYAGVRLGISNARIWTGPAVHNPLLFSGNSPGFTHLNLSTYKPIKTYIGGFEFNFLYGAQKPSSWFSETYQLGRQAASYQSVAYSPSFMDGFTIGFSGVFFTRYPDNNKERWEQAKRAFRINAVLNIADEESELADANRLGTLFLRWVLPKNNFEIYAEFGKNDRHVNDRDVRMQPEHHRAYLLGFIKSVPLSSNRMLAVGTEITQLNDPRSSFTRGGSAPWVPGSMGRWYYHFNQRDGFTNRGQVMGAPIGPSSQAQVITADLFTNSGRWGAKLARIAYNDGRPNETITGNYQRIQEANEEFIERWEVRNIELMVGLSATRFLRNNLEVTAGIDLSYIMNEHYIKKNDLFNTRFELTIRRQMNGWLR
ncbi:MAG: hypothetical protein EA360_09740 [Balneolaceae bacterium]|nr:MAG: hypothetical protein EA360_09740 [Balneolaceae bacterium]